MSCPGGVKSGLELRLAASWERIHPSAGMDPYPLDSETNLSKAGLGLLGIKSSGDLGMLPAFCIGQCCALSHQALPTLLLAFRQVTDSHSLAHWVQAVSC